jgi:tol-pal system protein YbgF
MKPFCLLCGVFFTFLSGCALREDVYNLDNRLTSLERRYSKTEGGTRQLHADVQGMNESSTKEARALRDQFARLRAELDGLRNEVRLLSGNLEGTRYSEETKIQDLEKTINKMQVLFARLEKDIHSNKNRTIRLEEYLSFQLTPKTDKKKTGGNAKDKRPDDMIYKRAKEAFDKGNFKSAREGFASLLKQYPDSKNADNAQFWIGEVYYREKWFQKAILEYQKVIEKYPGGNKVKSAFLKQGFSFLSLGDTANARLIFKKLIKKYPKSNEAEIAAKKLKAF